jgi:hypothetical protein
MNRNRVIAIILLFFSLAAMLSCNKDTAGPDGKNPMPSVSVFEPPDGACLFILGQADETEMTNYINQVRRDPPPAGFAFYTSLSNGAIQADLPRYETFLDDYPNSVLQLAIWTGERQWGEPGYYLDQIRNGQYDQNISALAQACKTLGKPVFIRFGYEFDGWHNAYPPDKYIGAYRYFVSRMRAMGVTNVAYVWHSWGVGAYYGSSDFPDYYPALPSGQAVTQALWYPGDDYVDWVAMSVFGTGWGDLSTNPVVQWLINFAENHGKPVMLAETAAIKTSGQSDPNWVIMDSNWFVHVFGLCMNNNVVKAFTYINVDWEGDNPASTWGDTRIQNASSEVGKYWLQNISSFQHGDSTLFETIGYYK